jgi:hypothetical protein|tara:strand:+ start:730 stop:1296 length:567 start_codon:yes stop_codon:yes gene_type:complete
MIKNVFKSLFKLLIGLGPLGALSIIFILLLFTDIKSDHVITSYVADYLIHSGRLGDQGMTFEDVADYTFRFLRELNIALLSLTLAMSFVWTVASHYLNINAPGKAKLYFIHWSLYSGILIGLLVAIALWFTESTAYQAQQFLSGGGKSIIYIGGVVFYTLMYYMGVLLGTARYARSSVLLANKLPGGF